MAFQKPSVGKSHRFGLLDTFYEAAAKAINALKNLSFEKVETEGKTSFGVNIEGQYVELTERHFSIGGLDFPVKPHSHVVSSREAHDGLIGGPIRR